MGSTISVASVADEGAQAAWKSISGSATVEVASETWIQALKLNAPLQLLTESDIQATFLPVADGMGASVAAAGAPAR